MSISPQKRVRSAMNTMRYAIGVSIIVVILMALGITGLFWVNPDRILLLSDIFNVSFPVIVEVVRGIIFVGLSGAGILAFGQIFILRADANRLEDSLNVIPETTAPKTDNKSVNPKRRVKDAIKTMRGAGWLTLIIMVLVIIGTIGGIWAPARVSLLAQLFGVTEGAIHLADIAMTAWGISLGALILGFQVLSLWKEANRIEEILDDVPQEQPDAPTVGKETPKVIPSASE